MSRPEFEAICTTTLQILGIIKLKQQFPVPLDTRYGRL